MSKEKILKAELDKVTDKLFAFGKPENKPKDKEHKVKETDARSRKRASAPSHA